MLDILILLEHKRQTVKSEVGRLFGNNNYHTIVIFVTLFWILTELGTAGIAGPSALVFGMPTCLALLIAGFVCLFTIILAPVGAVFL